MIKKITLLAILLGCMTITACGGGSGSNIGKLDVSDLGGGSGTSGISNPKPDECCYWSYGYKHCGKAGTC